MFDDGQKNIKEVLEPLQKQIEKDLKNLDGSLATLLKETKDFSETYIKDNSKLEEDAKKLISDIFETTVNEIHEQVAKVQGANPKIIENVSQKISLNEFQEHKKEMDKIKLKDEENQKSTIENKEEPKASKKWLWITTSVTLVLLISASVYFYIFKIKNNKKY